MFVCVSRVDFTASNAYQGERTFQGKCLHNIESRSNNPYQQVNTLYSEIGRTESNFTTDVTFDSFLPNY